MEPKTLKVSVNRKDFHRNGTLVPVHAGLRFEVPPGEVISLIGPSGCGKTTLLRMIAGLDDDYDGQITLGGQPVGGPDRNRAMVFQEARLLPWLTVERNVSFALPDGMSKRQRETRVAEVLRLVGLSASMHAWPNQLSGGMAKRVALARALINAPEVLLLDEPFSALDSLTKSDLQGSIRELLKTRNVTTLLVTHDLDEALSLSAKIGILTRSPSRFAGWFTVPSPESDERLMRLKHEILETLKRLTRKESSEMTLLDCSSVRLSGTFHRQSL
jgi:sulfonate transport system ATP-binding protein